MSDEIRRFFPVDALPWLVVGENDLDATRSLWGSRWFGQLLVIIDEVGQTVMSTPPEEPWPLITFVSFAHMQITDGIVPSFQVDHPHWKIRDFNWKEGRLRVTLSDEFKFIMNQ